MGMALCRRLVEKGWKVAIADIQENEVFAEELGNAASFHRCDVADYDRYVRFFRLPTQTLSKKARPRCSSRCGIAMEGSMRCVPTRAL